MLPNAASLLLRAAEPLERRLLILIYHRVHAEQDELFPREVTADVFRWQMDLVARFMSPVSLREGVTGLATGTLPRRAVAVTFDDGYADNRTVAAPILLAAGVPATFFIATGYLDGGRMWNDTIIEVFRRAEPGELDLVRIGLSRQSASDLVSRRALCRQVIAAIKHRPMIERQQLADDLAASMTDARLPGDLMMTSTQVKELSDLGFDIGGHTVSHPILRVLSSDEAEREIREGKGQLERITGRPLDVFAYPNGRPGEDYGPEHAAMVRELGFTLAVSTRRGVCSPRADRWQLPRFTPWDRTPARFLTRMLLEYRNAPAS